MLVHVFLWQKNYLNSYFCIRTYDVHTCGLFIIIINNPAKKSIDCKIIQNERVGTKTWKKL